MDTRLAKEFLHIRDWLDHRAITWATLATDLASWRSALAQTFHTAETHLGT